MAMRLLIVCLLSCFGVAADAFDSVNVIAGERIDDVETRYVALLRDLLQVVSDADVSMGSAGDGVNVYVGTADSHPRLTELAEEMGVALPTKWDPGVEGFVLASRGDGDACTVLIVGMDRRGVLYGIGEFLRRAVGRGAAIEFPTALHLRRAPRWPVRGLIVSQGHTMRELTGARAWTEEEHERAYLAYALAGANTFEIGETDRETFDFLKAWGLRAHTVVSGNVGQGPPEWRAKEAIGRQGYLSPAVPEARSKLLEDREALFARMPAFDSVHFKSGDGGGDESEAAAPYGRTFVRLCEEYAQLLRKYHPDTAMYVGNQKLDNAGDAAIFDYFRAHPDSLLDGVCYGPGSNAMGWTPGRRQDHRVDLFQYGRRGALSRYLAYMLHQLPPEKEILLFTDLTHWVYSQYGLMDHELIADRNYQTPPPWDRWMYERRPDEALAMVYNRRTFHARPRNYYKVFQETTEFTIGDVAYSEGHHDHLNTWMYQRLFWEPHQSVEDVVSEYARAHFGPEAAPYMADAIFQFEENLQTPIAENEGTDRLIELLEKAGEAMPEAVKARDYLWRMYMQTAYLNKYIQLDVRRQRTRIDATLAALEKALDRGELEKVVAERAAVGLPEESREMTSLKDKAAQLGEESARIYGVRSEGLFNLEQDYHGFGWLQRELERAAAESNEAREAIVRRVAHYEDAGPGGFYDNAGVPGGAPRLVYGWPYGDGGFSGANRRSQRTMAFTTDEARGVQFRYTGLDPDAQYRVRLTLVRPRYLERFGIFQHQTSQSIYADDVALVKDMELPEYESEFFDYEIPQEVTRDGELLLWMKKQDGIGEGLASDVSIWRNTGGWGTLVSEVWLLKQ